MLNIKAYKCAQANLIYVQFAPIARSSCVYTMLATVKLLLSFIYSIHTQTLAKAQAQAQAYIEYKRNDSRQTHANNDKQQFSYHFVYIGPKR